MAVRGRKPKPTKIKKLQGNPGKRTLNKHEPEFRDDGLPEPPKHLNKSAKDAWRDLAPVLHEAGLLSGGDALALETLCQTYAEWKKSIKALNKEGAIIVSPKGYPIQNPQFWVVNKLFDRLNAMFTKFGMTPSDRARLNLGSDDDEDEYEALKKASGL